MSAHAQQSVPSPLPGVSPRDLVARFDAYIAIRLVTICVAVAVFFGILLFGLFELFEFGDFLLTRLWRWDAASAALGCLAVLVGLLVLRIARRLALVTLGLVTARYDESPADQAMVRLGPDEQARFHELVEEVCRAVSAPRPDEIGIAADAECYVLEQRVFAWRTSRRLILVFGLPELLLLTTAELRMITAHELVHFRNRHTTVVVFLFRFLQSLRQALAPLRRRWWRRADPIYWLFSAFFSVVSRLATAIERRQELRADAVSAATYGGNLAVRTLLQDWLLANQFESALENYCQLVHAGRLSPQVNIYHFFAEHWREFSQESQDYLERRLIEEEEAQADPTGLTMRQRIQVMRFFPPRLEAESPPAVHLLTNLPQLEQELHARLVRCPH